MKVLFQNQGLITDEYRNFFKNNVPDDINLVFSSNSDPSDLIDEIADVEIFVGYRITESLMNSAKVLKHIQIPWTGFDRLDTSFIKNRPEITVSNSHSNSLAIAEHAVSLLLGVSKLIVLRHNKMIEGDWSPRSEDINSFWITGKNVGIIGYGAIGEKVAKMMKFGFNCKILALKRNKLGYREDDDVPDFKGGPSDLDYILGESDFILVGVPLTSETKDLISERELSLMKNEAIIVNIARGPIINEEALYKVLKENQIGGAGIDTWYNYPTGGNTTGVFQNYPFEKLENIIMSPHSAFKVRNRVEVFSQHILENIVRIYGGKEPINQVNLDLGY